MTDVRLPLMLGESPSKSGDRYWMFPLSGAPARTMCRLAGWPPDGDGKRLGDWTWALYSRFECRNVFDRHRHATPWSAPRARAAFECLLEQNGPWPGLVCLGRRVQLAVLGQTSIGYFEWVHAHGMFVVMIPHPSGLNRLLNDPHVRDRAGRVLQKAVVPSTLTIP